MYTKPILYLGRDRVDKSYYFIGAKEEVGRFIKYASYPYWCKSNMVGNFLDLGCEVPIEVLEEVMLFVNGVINYELLPKTRGRSESVVRLDNRTGNKTRFKLGDTKEEIKLIPETSSKTKSYTDGFDEKASAPRTNRRRSEATKLQVKTSSGNVGQSAILKGDSYRPIETISIKPGVEQDKPKRVRRTRAQIQADNTRILREWGAVSSGGNTPQKPSHENPAPTNTGRKNLPKDTPKGNIGGTKEGVDLAKLAQNKNSVIDAGSNSGTAGLQVPATKRAYRRKLKDI